MDALSQEDDEGLDPGNLYRTLRGLEDEGLVISSWDTSNTGPARRVYELTELGLEYLHAWMLDIRKTCQRLNNFLAEYQNYFQEERS
jgi:poly-beta-hydroxybutyrate-responsive repressor